MKCELTIDNLEITLSDNDLKIIKGISLKIRSGGITTLLGKSGSGKTTLCYAILRLLDNNSRVKGRINYCYNDSSINLLSLSESQISKIRGNQIAISFQEPSRFLNPALKCSDHLKDLVDYRKDEWVRGLFRDFGFTSFDEISKKYPYELSGGQAQKFSLILALSKKPKFVIADEPTSGIDYEDKKVIGQLFRKISKNENMGIFIVTHDISFAVKYSDYIAILEDGQILISNKKDKVLDSINNLYISKLLSSINLDNII